MKKLVRSMFALLLVCVLFASMALTASAAELDLTSEVMPIELENGPDAGYVIDSRISGLPFTMVASNVTNFLSSSVSNKGFVPRDYPGEVIWVHGMLFHSIVPGNIRSGICYYDAYQGIYIPGLYTNTRSEEPITIQKLASQLLQGTTYFGYIRNDAGGGAVNNGSITVSTY